MIDNPGFDRRRYPRVDASHLVSYSHYDEEEGLEDEGEMARTMDLSLGGVLIQVAKLLKMGTVLKLEIGIEDHIIAAYGHIVHIKQVEDDLYDVGIQFTKISTEALKILTKFYQ